MGHGHHSPSEGTAAAGTKADLDIEPKEKEVVDEYVEEDWTQY